MMGFYSAMSECIVVVGDLQEWLPTTLYAPLA